MDTIRLMKKLFIKKYIFYFGTLVFLCSLGTRTVKAQDFSFPTRRWGISIGNSQRFAGIRLNYRDSRVEKISGINITLWQPKKDNKDAIVQGISLGLIPGAGYLRGIQLGVLGVVAERDLKGISIGVLGLGSGGDVGGINIGGLGVGAGGNMKGINIGLLGAGAGEDLCGINIGGLGAGAGGDMRGINIGGLGVGAGKNLSGINIGGLGAGAGENMAGLNIGVFGVGAGQTLSGITIAGFGAGAGEELRGLTICGIGAGSPSVKGLTIAGLGVGGVEIKGMTLAVGTIRIEEDGYLAGMAVSGFNHIKGTMRGLSIGIINYAFSVKGLQIGLINIVRDNPKHLQVLPVFNTNF